MYPLLIAFALPALLVALLGLLTCLHRAPLSRTSSLNLPGWLVPYR